MNKLIATAVAVAFLTVAGPSPARAGESEWATAGKILTGVIGVTILGNAIANSRPYPVPVYAPPPRAYYPPEEVWVPGHYEARVESRWVPGYWEVERIERGNNNHYRGHPGNGYGNHHARRIWVPGYYRDVQVRVWIPGYWARQG